MKKYLVIVLVLLACFCAAGFMIWRHSVMYISPSQAAAIALEDAQLGEHELRDMDIDFEKTRFSAWYEVDFETHGMDYDYSIDAGSGEILHSSSKPDR